MSLKIAKNDKMQLTGMLTVGSPRLIILGQLSVNHAKH